MVQSLRLRRTTSTIKNELRTLRTRLMKGGEVDARPHPSVKILTQSETSKEKLSENDFNGRRCHNRGEPVW